VREYKKRNLFSKGKKVNVRELENRLLVSREKPQVTVG